MAERRESVRSPERGRWDVRRGSQAVRGNSRTMPARMERWRGAT